MTIDAGTWSLGDTEIIARAVVEAPSVHDTQPWNLRLPDHNAELEERLEFAEPGPDPLRADRLISCGTALANLELAIRVLGNKARTTLLPDAQRPELVARIETLGPGTPTSRDLRLYAAISHRRSHRESFADIPVPTETLADIVSAAADVPEVDVRLLATDEAVALAQVLAYAAEARRLHAHYQREMFSWTSHWQPRGNAEVVTTWSASLDERGAAGKALVTTGIPDIDHLAAAIARESVLLFSAPSTSPADLIRVGASAERAWLAAVDARLSASVLTHPLRVEDAGARLAEMLDLPVSPLVILRVGF
ncbi:nitroreductase family protein [Rhodococcus sp. NPDC047139]|uniref:nitroreductase family protein n=1 Tax=Rhodococcus sp. NPDC047139 TaxID=3155141 RepID=UPI0033E6440E